MKAPATKLLLLLLTSGCTFLTAGRCGDGVIDEAHDEVCDDGNNDNRDGCSARCDKIDDGFECPPRKPCRLICGNEALDEGEQCDPPGDNCSDECQSVCDENTDCDDNNDCTTNACDINAGECAFSIVNDGVACDVDNNNSTNDVCIAGICKAPFCGDGFINAGVEECDDKNLIDTDGCTSLCFSGPVCDASNTTNNFNNSERNFATATATGHCYFQVNDFRNFNQAEGDCASRVGHLVSIADANENALVDQVANNDQCWIGGSDQITEGTFLWNDGTPFTFSVFDSGQPDDFINEDCLDMRANGRWNDENCAIGQRFVCEIQ